MKVAVLADVPGWAQWSNAVGLQRYAPSGIKVDVLQLGQHGPLTDYDRVYCMNLPSAAAGHVGCVASHAWMYPSLDESDWRTRGVNPCRNAITGARHLNVLRGAVCRNQKLGEWARRHCQRVGVFPAGVDTRLYFPCEKPQRTLRVGWCGQVHDADVHGQVKGYREIYLPLVERCGDRYTFEAVTNTAANRRSPEDMARWFRSLDVFLSTSCNDGTPNPPFQAAACGAVVIGTDVGQLSDWEALDLACCRVPSYGNESEAAAVINEIDTILRRMEDPVKRLCAMETLLESIDMVYCYRRLAPKILEFVCA